MVVSSASAAVPEATDTMITLPLETVRAHLVQAAPLLTFETTTTSLPEASLGGRLHDFYYEQQPQLDMKFRFTEGGFGGDAPLSLGYHAKTADPALRRWISLPGEARKHDLWLGSRFSRYGWRDTPGWKVPGYQTPYYSDYILHLEAVDARRTRLEVIGLGARVRDGKEWSMTAQDGLPALPHRINAWKDVPPDPADKRDTLERLKVFLP